MSQYLNENKWEHRCHHGTVFRCKRCDFKGEPMIVTNWPRSNDGAVDGERFASDVAEMIAYHAVNILADHKLDPTQGFQGYDCIEWDLK